MATVENEKYYTKPEVAKFCIGKIDDIESYDIIVEPAAGSGAFSSQIPNCLSYDIAPESEDIIQCDFFSLSKISGNHILFIGNPPFGPRSALAKKFIRHCQILGAETIAFILPDTFSKVTNQSETLFPSYFNLISVTKLGNDAFTIQGQTYHVPCSFYIWTKRKSNINLRKKKYKTPKSFMFLPRKSIEADFVINGNSGKVRSVAEVTNPKAEHYIRIKDKSDIQHFRKIFSKLDYRFESSCNGGNAWISQQEILEAYYNYLNNDLH